MTQQELRTRRWTANTRILYRGHSRPYGVISVDFDEALICLDFFPEEERHLGKWVRCEHCAFYAPSTDECP